MDPRRIGEYQQRLYDLTPPSGDAISEVSLRELLQAAFPHEHFTLEDYWALRRGLVAEGRLESAPKPHESVRRIWIYP